MGVAGQEAAEWKRPLPFPCCMGMGWDVVWKEGILRTRERLGCPLHFGMET